ncbi:hypothetical protein SAMN05216249_10255 [Acetitomaculum ruminis DSM 5522]|uniref:LPXTG-motif cell wall anchor domain-containing protein n=1 Tax=Acetitomaculum ruminis DSM 5522 TaxID=1120918 RepID=A0A1I0VM82_9FIRM|nr:hypothetical protein [Acetitomaculum ruminis]SFA76696.1 hypothetical protein SAMN05216249_10255 [Acetitomaculum ruminis DSM 5522]
MKKKIFALLTVLVFVMAEFLPVLAASPTVQNTDNPVKSQKATTYINDILTGKDYLKTTTVLSQYKLSATSDTRIEACKVAIQNLLLNDLTNTGLTINNNELVNSATDGRKVVTATALSIVDIEPTTATKQSDDKYHIALNVAGISASEIYAILHYNDSGWEVISPLTVTKGSITFAASDCGTFAVVKLLISNRSSASPSVSYKSPKTGESRNDSGIILMFFAVGAAAFCAKKYFEKESC